MKYILLMPEADMHGNRMLDYIMDEKPADVKYEKVFDGDVFPPLDATMLGTLEFLWQRHNVGDNGNGNRPLARTHRSMCIGDIIILLNEVWVAAPMGFEQLEGDAVPDSVRPFVGLLA